VNVASGQSSSANFIGARDLNGDGYLDLFVTSGAVVNGADSPYQQISVLFGKGDGTFQSAAKYLSGGASVSIATGDFNQDGRLDLAVVNPYCDNVAILLGTASDRFQQPIGSGKLPVPTPSTTLAAADFNLDGKLDLAVAEGNQGLTILLGNGDGTFQKPIQVTAGQTASVAVGDFNGDGIPDLVTASLTNGYVLVLLGNGDGTFSARAEYQGQHIAFVAVADINLDSKADIVGIDASGTAVVFLGNGDGTFQPPVGYNAGLGPVTAAIGDLNGDGNPDLVIACSNSISVLLGNGNGTFQLGLSYPVAGGGPTSVAIADLNGDGRPDLAVAAGGNVTVMIGNGNGTFQPAVNYPLSAQVQATWILIGDFNGDGKLDAVTSNATADNVAVLLGNGDGAFEPEVTYYLVGYGTAGTISLPYLGFGVVQGDFNGDGKPDLALANTTAAYVAGPIISLLTNITR
jgi:hypothetical protein